MARFCSKSLRSRSFFSQTSRYGLPCKSDDNYFDSAHPSGYTGVPACWRSRICRTKCPLSKGRLEKIRPISSNARTSLCAPISPPTEHNIRISNAIHQELGCFAARKCPDCPDSRLVLLYLITPAPTLVHFTP